jgi:hypothetical protein
MKRLLLSHWVRPLLDDLSWAPKTRGLRKRLFFNFSYVYHGPGLANIRGGIGTRYRKCQKYPKKTFSAPSGLELFLDGVELLQMVERLPLLPRALALRLKPCTCNHWQHHALL